MCPSGICLRDVILASLHVPCNGQKPAARAGLQALQPLVLSLQPLVLALQPLVLALQPAV
jgi:hypothetical protein